jgi:hypothetical protein
VVARQELNSWVIAALGDGLVATYGVGEDEVPRITVFAIALERR